MIYLKKITPTAVLAISILSTTISVIMFPAEAQACGSVETRPYNSGRTVSASGTIRNSCPGWTEVCVTLWWQGVVGGYPIPRVVSIPKASACSSLRAGGTKLRTTASVGCQPGFYYSLAIVKRGNAQVKSVYSDRYDFTGNC